MLTFHDWTLAAAGILARQHDHLTRRLEILGDLPQDWDWAALIKPEKLDGAMDILALYPMEGGIGADLTAGQLCVDGYYRIQLRGTQGDRVRHTNVLQVFVSPSLTGEGQWPELPSEFGQMEARLRDIATHPPIPGEVGYWLLWDPDAQQYVESEFPLPEGEEGPAGADGYTPVKGVDYWTSEDQQSIVSDVLSALPAAEGVGF